MANKIAAVCVRLEEKVKDQLQDKAFQTGHSIGSYLRLLIHKHLKIIETKQGK